MKEQDRIPTDLTTDFNEELVVGSLPNLRYQRAIKRFVGDKAIDVAKLTQISFELDASSYFYNDKRHDLADEIDKGYIAFNDLKNSR